MFTIANKRSPYAIGMYVQNFVQRWSGCHIYWTVKSNRIHFMGAKLPSHGHSLRDKLLLNWADLLVRVAVKMYMLTGQEKNNV